MYKMQRVDPALIPEEAVKINEKKLESLTSSFTDASSKDFEMNSEFIHLFAWASHFASVCKFSRSVKHLEDKLEEGAKRKAFLQEQKVRYEACLDDLQIFEIDSIQQEKDILETIINEINENKEKKDNEMEHIQKRYLEYESGFFAQVNAAKRQSKISGTQ
jgi:hypothetical protein